MSVFAYFLLLLGENKSTYTIHFPTIRNAGRYYCKVQNRYGKVKSDPAKVTVKDHYNSPSKSEESTTPHSNEEVDIFQIQDSTSPTNVKG